MKKVIIANVFAKNYFFLYTFVPRMSVLCIFNPEHDLALAANLSNFTAPHAGRQLRADLGYLPAIWAGEDAYVLVDDMDFAQKTYSRLMHRPFNRFVERQQLSGLRIDAIEPWGWDAALCSYLLRQGIDVSVLPDAGQLAVIRNLSHRRQAMLMLDKLQTVDTTGRDWEVKSMGDLSDLMQQLGYKAVVKAPWSSSGRGIRFVQAPLTENQYRWVERLIARQGSVMVEPYYRKIRDFGMEFLSDGQGLVSYVGLSLFHTSNGAYTGNVIADEQQKSEMISEYIAEDLLESVRSQLCIYLGQLLCDGYQGPLGVDMMVVASPGKEGFLLHPCVEINLRRTMGHVAIALAGQCPSGRVMNIDFQDNHYKLKIRRL